MRKAAIFVQNQPAGTLEELPEGKYRFSYLPEYQKTSVSLTMPLSQQVYIFTSFPPFFEGLLPEGLLLEAMLRKYKLDKYDYFGQLITVGNDAIGAVSIKEIS